MKAAPGPLAGSVVFEPAPVHDERGFFTRTFDAAVAAEHGVDPASLVQDSQSRSRHGVLRGLHVRTDGGEGKLVRCASGAVLDVAVDLRPWSPTYRRWMSLRLDDADHRSVWLPPGLAHGFQVLSDVADVCYRIDRVHAPGCETAIRYDDPDLGVVWPLPVTDLSPRDRAAPAFRDVESRLGDWFPHPGAKD
ncbi:dTDP-4-dehydrorhamnose 3,5-epimerase [Kineosporia sp. A_224]|uniref:dTDP-4-dehydrorhamnose 3,5-epimerase n=1 Tax=Kineosporia sp. A_224 TaxID=1962180 RepID=UPI000B4BA1A4|nr:dTDP-4-dehydrorhamnose 3,5-epimerase [Kineosporia sp. A_224]